MLNCYVINGTFSVSFLDKAASKREQSQTCLNYAEREQLRDVYRRKINKKSRFCEHVRACFLLFFNFAAA